MRYFTNLTFICIFATQLLDYCRVAICYNFLYYSRKRNIVSSLSLLVGSTSIILLIAIGLVRRRNAQRRQAFRQLLERRQQPGLALVRYVMLNRQCSEEQTYQRIATFLKTHFPNEDPNEIDELLSNDRQRLLHKVGSILVHHPNDIDKI